LGNQRKVRSKRVSPACAKTLGTGFSPEPKPACYLDLCSRRFSPAHTHIRVVKTSGVVRDGRLASTKMTRFGMLWLLLCALGLVLGASRAGAEVKKVTHTYKQVGDLDIKADIVREEDERVRPVVVWIHGGALINGHRESVPGWLTDAARQQGWVLVSLDYRLAPETQLPEIIADLEDAFRWIDEQGPKLFHADPKRVAVVGGSAGGYLTLTAGFRAKPRPIALVSLWGYGDLVGPWYSEPSPHPAHHQSKLSREEAWKQVSGPPISDSRDRKGNGGGFYQYCRQTGVWPKAVSGWDPKREPEKFYPFMAVKNVTADYPATLLIHGENDTDVPFEQSAMMAEAFQKQKVPHRLIRVANAEHGLAGAKKEDIDEAYRAAVAFLKEKLEGK
jgi:acetyl esterase/lipase